MRFGDCKVVERVERTVGVEEVVEEAEVEVVQMEREWK